jgi:hypothetical protein
LAPYNPPFVTYFTLGVPAMRRAIETLWPLWLVTVAITVVHVLAGSDRSQPVQLTPVDNAFFVLSTAVLPFVAGFLYLRRCAGRMGGAALAGASIPLADVVGVGLAYSVLQAGWLAFGGFLIATAAFSLAPSAIFGIAGRWAAQRYERGHT